MISTVCLTRAIAFLLLATIAITSTGIGILSSADAKVVRRAGRSDPALEPNVPLLAIVGLAEQRVTIYDATGKILQSPVSSGQTGLETPQGIFSVVQKEEEHTSNIYDDASMPFMQRVTWTGIALHAGALPGYPASHGCVRMPYEFAQELFGLTKLGLRVVIARQDIAPVEIAGPAFFKTRQRLNDAPAAPTSEQLPAVDASGRESLTAGSHSAVERRHQLVQQLRRLVSAREATAEAAVWKEQDARQTAARVAADAATALRALKQAEANIAKDESDLKAAEKALEAGGPPAKIANAERAKAQAMAGIEAKRAQLQVLQAQTQAKTEAVKTAEQEARAASAAKNAAAEAVSEAKQNMAPVSVFISRKTQRLYVRKAQIPIFEAPVFIHDPNRMLGSFVFTALEHDDKGDMRWNVVSLFKNATDIEPPRPSGKTRPGAKGSEPVASDVGAAKAVLERITVSDEARDRISEVVLPGSSLIISDEGPSIETGKDTDFVVVMSGEPQGGIAMRQHPPRDDNRAYSSARNEESDNGNRKRARRSSGGGGGSGFPFWFD